MKKFLLTTAMLAATVAHANDEALLADARKVTTTLAPKLMAVLQQELAKSGAEGAIPVCKDMAPVMAAEVSQQTGWKIKRASLKTRNDARGTPDGWEKAALEDFEKRAAVGESPAKLEKGEQVGNEYRYVKAVPMQAQCLACHGTADQISPAVKAVIDRHYPNDRATGYALGQIRGVISVRKGL